MKRRSNSRLPRAGDRLLGQLRRGAANNRLSPRLLFFFCVLGVALYFVVGGGEYSILEARGAKAELAARVAETEAVRGQIDSLRARIHALKHDDEALERVARERYGFIRDGEYLYRIYEDPDAAEERAGRSFMGWLRGDRAEGR